MGDDHCLERVQRQAQPGEIEAMQQCHEPRSKEDVQEEHGSGPTQSRDHGSGPAKSRHGRLLLKLVVPVVKPIPQADAQCSEKTISERKTLDKEFEVVS
jgi:hypothetical protein